MTGSTGRERLGPLTEYNPATGRRVVTAETAAIIAQQLASVAEFERNERRMKREAVLNLETSN